MTMTSYSGATSSMSADFSIREVFVKFRKEVGEQASEGGGNASLDLLCCLRGSNMWVDAVRTDLNPTWLVAA